MAVTRDGSSRTDGHPLPCGRSVEDILDAVDTGAPDPHAAGCEHCTTARRSLHELAAATQALVDDPAEPPSGMLERIMSAVRADIRASDVLLPLITGAGPAEVSHAAVAAVLRYAADSVDGVWSRSCLVEPDPATATGVRVTMTLSLRYGAGPFPDLLGDTRRRIATALAGQVGLVATTVDLTVVDVWPEGGR